MTFFTLPEAGVKFPDGSTLTDLRRIGVNIRGAVGVSTLPTAIPTCRSINCSLDAGSSAQLSSGSCSNCIPDEGLSKFPYGAGRAVRSGDDRVERLFDPCAVLVGDG